MPRELTADERDDLTPEELAAIMGAPSDEDAAAAALVAEQQAAADEAARVAAAGTTKDETKPEVDEDGEPIVKPEPTPEEIAAAAEADAAAKAKAGEKTEPTEEDLAALLAEESAPAPTVPKPVTYKGITDADYKKGISELDAKKAEAMQQLMDGTIDAAGYTKIESEVAAARDELVSDRTLAKANAEALEHANAAKMADFQTAIGALMKASKGQAVDYNTDAKAQAAFDNASHLIGADPDNAGLSPQEVCNKAHAMVLALRGISVNASPPAPTPAAAKTAALAKSPPPTTLGGLPAAAPNAVGADLRAQFNLLEGEEAEEFLERLPKAQRLALLTGAAV